MRDLVVAGFGAVLLHGYLQVVRSKWPDNYFSLTSQIEYRTSRGKLGYAIFRFLPVAVVLLLVAVSAERLDGDASIALILATSLHLADTSGRLVYAELRARAIGRPVNGSRTLLGVAVAIPVVGLAAVLSQVADSLADLVPTADKFVEALWTAAVTAVATALVLQSTKKSADLPDIVRREAELLADAGLMEHLEAVAAQSRTSPAFLQSIMITENLQRPRWFRNLENLLAPVRRSGTYGIMQVTSHRRLTDIESIDATAEAFAGYLPEYGTSSVIEPYLRAAFSRHNQHNRFVDMAVEIFGELAPTPQYATNSRAADGRPLIEVLQIEQSGQEWRIKGTASVHEGNVAWRHSGSVSPSSGHINLRHGPPRRSPWTLMLPIRVREFWIGEPQEADHVQDDASRWTKVETHYVY